MAENNKKFKRNIYFYDLVPILDESKVDISDKKAEQNAIIKTFKRMKKFYEDFIEIKKQKNPDEKKANELLYQVHFMTERGDYLYILVDDIKDNKIKFRIVRCRTSAFPYIEMDGKLEKITEKIEGKFDVAEVTHCIIFADKNLMGAEYNSAGARATSLPALIAERNYEVKSLKVLNKLNQNALNRLIRKRNFKLFDITIKNTPEIIAKMVDKSLLSASIHDYDFDTVTITMKRRMNKTKNGFIPPVGIDELKDLIETNGEDIERLVVDQGLYSKEINLLSDKIVENHEFEYDEKERILDKEIVYTCIENIALGIE